VTRIATLFLATLLALAAPARADQRPDGFGPADRPDVIPPDRDAGMLSACFFQTWAKNPAGKTYDLWLCRGGAIVAFPTPCSHDPYHTCKET
jgi:hypothetical protein